MTDILDIGVPKSRTLTAGVGLAGGGTLAADRTFTAAIPSVQDFRLTLTTALPVTTADVTGATTIYFTPYKGRMIALYDGAAWALYSTNEISLALGTLTSGLPYDVFVYNNSGTITLEFLAWTNGTTRATALVRQDGVWSKTGALTRRYVGTFYTTSTTATEDSAAKRFLFNADNQVPRHMIVKENTDSWTYTTNTWRSANNSTANRIQFVDGLGTCAVWAKVRALFQRTSVTTNSTASVAPALDSTTAPETAASYADQNAGAEIRAVTGEYSGVPGLGFHYLQWIETCGAVGTGNWYGDAGAPEAYQSAIWGEITC